MSDASRLTNEIDMLAVVRRLTGPINPVGESHTDDVRYEKLKELTTLVENLVADIEVVAGMRDRPEFSIKRAGNFAHDFLNLLRSEP